MSIRTIRGYEQIASEKLAEAGRAMKGGIKSALNAIKTGLAPIGAATQRGATSLTDNVERAVEYMEGEGRSTEGGGALAYLKPAEISIPRPTKEFVKNNPTLSKVVNFLGDYHENVLKKTDRVSSAVARGAHLGTRVVLLFPLTILRVIFKAAGFRFGENAVALVQNAVALAVGLFVRATLMTVMQVVHALPYVAVLAVAGGVGLGVVLVGIKVGVVAAFLVASQTITIGVLVAMQRQISRLRTQEKERDSKDLVIDTDLEIGNEYLDESSSDYISTYTNMQSSSYTDSSEDLVIDINKNPNTKQVGKSFEYDFMQSTSSGE